MVKCTTAPIRKLETALRWKISAVQRAHSSGVATRQSAMTQPPIVGQMSAFVEHREPRATWPMTAAGSRRSSRSRSAAAFRSFCKVWSYVLMASEPFSIREHDAKQVAFVLSQGADPNKPLTKILGVRLRIEIVRLLIEVGANVNFRVRPHRLPSQLSPARPGCPDRSNKQHCHFV
jgi:hypothetical protein